MATASKNTAAPLPLQAVAGRTSCLHQWTKHIDASAASCSNVRHGHSRPGSWQLAVLTAALVPVCLDLDSGLRTNAFAPAGIQGKPSKLPPRKLKHKQAAGPRLMCGQRRLGQPEINQARAQIKGSLGRGPCRLWQTTQHKEERHQSRATKSPSAPIAFAFQDCVPQSATHLFGMLAPTAEACQQHLDCP